MTNTAKSLRSPPPDSDLILTLDVEKPSDSQLKLGKAVLEFDTYIRVRLLQRAGHAGHVEVSAPTAARGGGVGTDPRRQRHRKLDSEHR